MSLTSTTLPTSCAEGGTMAAWAADVPGRLARLAETLPTLLGEAMAPFGGLGTLSLLCAAKPAADDTLKVLVRDARRRPAAVVLWSAPANPSLVARGVSLARQAKERLGSAGVVVLDPLLTGELDGLSYMVLPYCTPVSQAPGLRKLERVWRRQELLRWLRAVARQTAQVAAPEACDQNFVSPLLHLASDRAIPTGARVAAREAVERLRSGAWAPRSVLAHNDFWWGNILRQRSIWPQVAGQNSYRFLVIDWAGAAMNGPPIFDLVCIAISLGLAPARLAAEAASHCAILDNHPREAIGYGLAALGRIGLHLEHCPRGLYLDRVARAWRLLSKAAPHLAEDRPGFHTHALTGHAGA